MISLSLSQLNALGPYGQTWIKQGFCDGINAYGDHYQINTSLRLAHFTAQVAHECDNFNTTKEYGRALRYDPFRGRGLIMVTWKVNYQDFYNWCVTEGFQNVPTFYEVDNLQYVEQFPWAFLGAIWYWTVHNLNNLADNDDVNGITKIINGGYNGLADRVAKLKITKRIFGIGEPIHSILDIQNALNAKGFNVCADGVMGPETTNAIKQFQKQNNLTADGIVGPNTTKFLFS